MKKMFFLLTLLLILGIIPSVAYAAPVKADTALTVTGGVKDEKTESTFDDSRIISGESEKGAIVTIEVFLKNAGGDMEECSSYEIEIGTTGLFSQTVELSIGENVICVTSEKDDKNPVTESYTIKRKKKIIKQELENGISIPGESSSSNMNFFYFR